MLLITIVVFGYETVVRWGSEALPRETSDQAGVCDYRVGSKIKTREFGRWGSFVWRAREPSRAALFTPRYGGW